MFKFDRESVCATCLSQNRMLFAVSDVPSCAKFYTELWLKWTDKLCWECHHMVRKLVLFKNKAKKAQAWLQNTTTSQQQVIPCLSTLVTSPGSPLNITDPGLISSTIPEPDFVSVKDEVIDESAGEVRIKEEEIEIEIEEEEIKKEKVGVEEPKPVKSRKRKKSPPPIKGYPDLFTEEKLSEGGLTEWWQRKRTMKYFTNSLPGERCDRCVQPFDCEQFAKNHAKKHTEIYGDFECDVCEQRLVDARHLEFHRKLHYRIVKCNRCDFVWDDRNTMRDHCSDVHGVKQTLWDCEPCQKQFMSRKQYANHMRSHRRTTCPECMKVLNQECLSLHIKVQHCGMGAKRTCAECGGSYPAGEPYLAHLQAHNTETDPAAFCTECMTQFKNMTLYHTHMTQTQNHAVEKEFRYQCRFCSMKFIKNVRLRQHRQIHNDVSCDQCEQTFISVKARDSHIKKSHEKLRDVICDYCGKGFSNKKGLVEHINSHTGARPFVCKLCGADFGYKSALYLHGRYKHKIPKKNVDKNSQKKGNSGKNRHQKNSVKDSQ